jgi:hypothetical protein
MVFFTGRQLAVAIEDLAKDALTYSEENVENAVIDQLLDFFPMRREDFPRRLVNGLMRGSTSINREQIVEDIQRIQRNLNNDLDPWQIMERILLNIEVDRKEVHIARTQKSAVRQILRALNEVLELVPTVPQHNIESFVNTQDRLNNEQMSTENELRHWADRVVSLYADLFVSQDQSENSSFKRPKGIVTKGAARNYVSVWSRFIEANYKDLVKRSPNVDISTTSSKLSNSISNLLMISSDNLDELKSKVTVEVHKLGPNTFDFSKTWNSKELAKKGLSEFIETINAILAQNERIDYAVVEISGEDETVAKIGEITTKKLETFIKSLL